MRQNCDPKWYKLSYALDWYFQARKLHLHNLLAKSYEDIQQIPVQGAKMKMSEYVCAAKVINNFGTIMGP